MGEVRSTEAYLSGGMGRGGPPVSGDEGHIGRALQRSGSELLSCGQSLSTLVEPAGQTLIREAISTLRDQAFRVVVVGQIKSGKSSFINALAGQPFLLPADVTPWTTAITNLHFAKPAPNKYAAAFHFFSEDEWQELAVGGGPLRELTHRLVPGFDADMLRQHVESLKHRASSRLGNEFVDLLGGIHYFQKVDRNQLLHYVCSGEFSADAHAPSLGKYADITKRADLYLDTGPFEFPVTVTDTPGTNDPFLIRDEITRRSLKSADLFIVVLSARQPLSDADLALLRLMHGLNKDRIVAFVNRIDDFSDVSYDLAEVLMYVERKLRAEFPGTTIPVIAGSAAWANCALSPNSETFRHVLKRRSIGYLAELGLVHDEDRTPAAMLDPARHQRLCRGLLSASGLPQIYHVIADRMRFSQAARSQLQVARCFREMAQASASSLRYEYDNVKAAPHQTTPAPMDLAEFDNRARMLDEVAANVERSGQTIEQQLRRILDEEMTALNNELMSAVSRHANAERRVLVDALRRGRVPRAWTHEGVELRRTLAEVFAKRFGHAAGRIVAFQNRVSPELHRLMGLLEPQTPRPAEPNKSALEIPLPNVAALSRFVALDLDGAWWAGFWKRRDGPEAYGNQIEALIKSEFQAVVDELVQTADATLRGYAATTTKWSFGLCMNIVQAVKRRRQDMAAHSASAQQTTAASAQAAETQRQKHAGQIDERLRLCQALNGRLEQIFGELGGGFAPQESAAP
jgi:signal recognition particle receptor subunit beta